MLELLTKLNLRVRALLRRSRLEKDLDDEIAFHMAMREQKLREAGTADPKSAAHRRFGNRTRIVEDLREAWSFATLERVWADVRIGGRFIRKNRWAMMAIVLSLSLGIGATAVVFNLFDFLLLRSFPVAETNRVVRIVAPSQANATNWLMSNADFEDLRKRAQSFEGIMSVSPDQIPYVIAHPGQQGRNLVTSLVSGNFFAALHLEPVVGRGFRPEEDEVPGRDAVAVISDNLWRREYGRDRGVIGKTIRVNAKDFTIVGVAPAGFYGLDPIVQPEVYLPRVMEGVFANEATLTDRASRRLQVVARLKDGVTLDQARAEITRIGAEIEREYPSVNRGQRLVVHSQLGAKMAFNPEVFVGVGLFFIVAGLVLGIACINVANLLLSTAPARTREMAIRMAMGASRGRLVRQVLIESILVSFGGTLAGLVLAQLVAQFVRSVELFSNLPINLNVTVDVRVALFAGLVGIAAGFVSGLIPAIRSSRSDLNGLLKADDPHIASTGKMRFRRGLVVTQVAVAVVVLVLSGLSLAELQVLREADPGFRMDHVLRVALSSIPQNKAFYKTSLERLRTLPGVRAAALVYPEPFGVGNEWTNLVIDGYTQPPDQPYLPIMSAAVSDGYFDTLRIPMVRGRAFNVRDRQNSAKVAIINEAMAAKYWPDRDALGSWIRTVGPSAAGKQAVMLEVVGIARNSKHRNMSEDAAPFLYLPMKEDWSEYGTLLVLTDGEPGPVIPIVRRELMAVDPNPPIYDSGTLAAFIRRQALVVERLMAQVMTGVGMIGLVLSVLGLYGVIAYSVSRRTHEIGIRIAIGATTRNVMRWVLTDGLRLSAAGIAVGLIVSSVLKTWLGTLFTFANSAGTTSITALVFAAVIGGSLAVMLLACYIPARRASLVDPNIALRCDY